eukprot:1165595-Prymnesium_polylepis.1
MWYTSPKFGNPHTSPKYGDVAHSHTALGRSIAMQPIAVLTPVANPQGIQLQVPQAMNVPVPGAPTRL